MFDKKNLITTTALNRKLSSYFVFSTHKDCSKSPVYNYPSFQVIDKLNFLFAN